MAAPAASRKSLIVSLILTIVIGFGSLATTLSLGWGPKLGLDLAGGLSVVYKPTTTATSADMNEVVTILSNRVNGLGVSGATVNLQGKNVVVSVPGVTHARAVLAAVGQTAQLFFRPVLCQVAPASKTAKPIGSATMPSCGAAYAMTEANLAVTPDSSSSAGYTNNTPGVDPSFANIATTKPALDIGQNPVILPTLGQSASIRYLLGGEQLTGQAIGKA